jgi:hypothetical protein
VAAAKKDVANQGAVASASMLSSSLINAKSRSRSSGTRGLDSQDRQGEEREEADDVEEEKLHLKTQKPLGCWGFSSELT